MLAALALSGKKTPAILRLLLSRLSALFPEDSNEVGSGQLPVAMTSVSVA
jgi:hypothetical protein